MYMSTKNIQTPPLVVCLLRSEIHWLSLTTDVSTINNILNQVKFLPSHTLYWAVHLAQKITQNHKRVTESRLLMFHKRNHPKISEAFGRHDLHSWREQPPKNHHLHGISFTGGYLDLLVKHLRWWRFHWILRILLANECNILLTG